MIRRFKVIRCPHCLHRFRAADIEDECTYSSMPVYCPKCGQRVYLSHLHNTVIWAQEKIGGRIKQDKDLSIVNEH